MADDKLEGRRKKKSFLDKRLRNKELRKALDEGEMKIGVALPVGGGGAALKGATGKKIFQKISSKIAENLRTNTPLLRGVQNFRQLTSRQVNSIARFVDKKSPILGNMIRGAVRSARTK